VSRPVRFVALAACAAVLTTGCSDSGGSTPELEDPLAGSTTTPSSRPPSSGTEPRAAADDVQVDVQLTTRQSPASRAFVEFIAARVDSMRGGEVTTLLRRRSTPAQLQAQSEAVSYAANRGLTVPSRPRVAVVSTKATGGTVTLGVCLWLPSTEFVDSVTGAAPGDEVPRAWLPATATLVRSGVTWVVDTVVSPGAPLVDLCRGLS